MLHPGDELAIRSLIAAYSRFVDRGEAGRVGDLFTDDAVWSSPEVTMRGRDEITAGFGRRQSMARTSRHVCTDTLLEASDDADVVTGETTVTLYRADGEFDGPAPIDRPFLIGTYYDRFVRTADGWRYADRRTTVEFTRRKN